MQAIVEAETPEDDFKNQCDWSGRMTTFENRLENYGSTKKVRSKEINKWPSFHLDIALNPSHAS